MSGKMKPSSTSTPDRAARISARPSVHDHNSYLSPILKPNNNPAVTDDSEDEENSEEDLSSEETASNKHSGLERSSSEHSGRERSASGKDNSLSYHHTSEGNRQCRSGSKKLSRSLSNFNSIGVLKESDTSNSKNILCMSTVIVLFLALVCVSLTALSPEPLNLNIPNLKVLFPSQSVDLWNAVESGVEEVKRFNKPSVFLILYKPSTEETLHRMLQEMTKYSSCIVNNNCEIKPIILSDSNLHTYNDYGSLISKYKSELENKAVMVVHNLDEISGQLAQVFHSLCDEYNPLVNKAVFFFTIKITDPLAKKSDLQLVEEILKDKWSDLKDDIFYPLFTRISSMVLNIAPEV